MRIRAESSSNTKINVKARKFSLIVDEPQEIGGTDDGANPMEYILAGLAGCINAVGHTVAKQMGIQLNSLKINIVGEINIAPFVGLNTADRSGFKNIKVSVTVGNTSLSQETLNKWFEKVEKICPVTDNLKNPTAINFKVVEQ